MNCGLVRGLRWCDLSIIVLCQDIAAIDSSDTKLSLDITHTSGPDHFISVRYTVGHTQPRTAIYQENKLSPVHLLVLGQDQVVPGQRHAEDDGRHSFETVNPLLPL